MTPVIHNFKTQARVGGDHSQAGAPVPLLVLLITLQPPHTARRSGPSRPQLGSWLGSKSRHKLKCQAPPLAISSWAYLRGRPRGISLPSSLRLCSLAEKRKQLRPEDSASRPQQAALYKDVRAVQEARDLRQTLPPTRSVPSQRCCNFSLTDHRTWSSSAWPRVTKQIHWELPAFLLVL